MLGTILNVTGILAGGIIGLTRRGSFSPKQERFLEALIGFVTVVFGLRITILSLSGSFSSIVRQLVILVLALMIGQLFGRLFRLQELSNKVGQMAKEMMAAPGNAGERAGRGFKACSALFCAAPLGILGTVVDGLSGYFQPLAIKGLMDGLATMGLVSLFGWGAVLSALPVFVFEGSLTLFARQVAAPFLVAHGLLNSVNAVSGMLVFSVALVTLHIKRVALANYLPSLLVAPVLTWFWR